MFTLEFHSAVTVQFKARRSPWRACSRPVLFRYTFWILFTRTNQTKVKAQCIHKIRMSLWFGISVNCYRTWSVSQELVGVRYPTDGGFTGKKANIEVRGTSDNKALSVVPNDVPVISAKSSVRKLQRLEHESFSLTGTLSAIEDKIKINYSLTTQPRNI